MKNMLKSVYILSALAMLPSAAHAQLSGGLATAGTGRFSSEYVQNPNAERATQWWWGLEKEVNLPASVSYRNVDASDIQEIIFFAGVHGGRMDLRASIPQLLEVYKSHEDVRLRMMSVAALHAIGDRFAMAELREAVGQEESPLVRRMTRRAIKSFEAQALAAQ